MGFNNFYCCLLQIVFFLRFIARVYLIHFSQNAQKTTIFTSASAKLSSIYKKSEFNIRLEYDRL
jgi:hypothetical protein